MPIHRVAAKDFITNAWSGGTTTQLLIYPKGSSLSERNFEVRISSARVEQSGAFSDFSGYDRLLLILKGQLRLSGDATVAPLVLNEHSPAWSFDGGQAVWAEVERAPVEDFNLFVPKGILKTATQLDLGEHQRWQQPAQPGASVYGIFMRGGNLQVDDTQLNSEYPLIISSTPLKALAVKRSQLVSFAIGCQFR